MSHRSLLSRVYGLLLLVVACRDATPPASLVSTRSDLTPPPCRLRFEPLQPSLAAATESAAERWSAATGCDIALAAPGERGDVTVELTLRIDKPDGTQAPGITSDDLQRIYIHAGSRASQQWETVPHEFCHVFGVGPEHLPGDGLCGGKGHGPAIDEAALEVACSRLACSAFNPEP